MCTNESHGELKRDLLTFRAATKFCGLLDVGDGEVLELRNCLCGSTLAMTVERP